MIIGDICFMNMCWGGVGLLCRDKLNPKVLSNEELLIVLRRQINIDRDQKAVVIDQTNSRHLWPAVANARSRLPSLSCADPTCPVGKLSAIICRGLCINFAMALCRFSWYILRTTGRIFIKSESCRRSVNLSTLPIVLTVTLWTAVPRCVFVQLFYSQLH